MVSTAGHCIRITIIVFTSNCPCAANDDSEDTDSHDEEDDETNDRVIPVTQDFYSADDIQMNDETSPTAP